MTDRDNVVNRLWSAIDDDHMEIIQLKQLMIDLDIDYARKKEILENKIVRLYKNCFDNYSEILNYRTAESEPTVNPLRFGKSFNSPYEVN